MFLASIERIAMPESTIVPNRADRRHPERLASRPEVAHYLGVAPKTLAEWASRSVGPRYYRVAGGGVRYRWTDVEKWLDAQQAGGGAA